MKLSQLLLGAVFLVVIGEGWWQESLLIFSASPTTALNVPIQDHGIKYVAARDAEIIHLFRMLFYLMFLPFLALAIGHEGLRHVRGGEAERQS